jgi:hypothetical protein
MAGGTRYSGKGKRGSVRIAKSNGTAGEERREGKRDGDMGVCILRI